jgi:hypothetical protein
MGRTIDRRHFADSDLDRLIGMNVTIVAIEVGQTVAEGRQARGISD